MSKAKTRTIDIRTTEGVKSVEAVCRGGLAVHGGFGWSRGMYTITHLPSGLAVMTGLETEAVALRAVRDLLKLWDWSVPVTKAGIPRDLSGKVEEIATKYDGLMRSGIGRVDKRRLCPKGFNAEVLSA